jgi:hypothetical protein
MPSLIFSVVLWLYEWNEFLRMTAEKERLSDPRLSTDLFVTGATLGIVHAFVQHIALPTSISATHAGVTLSSVAHTSTSLIPLVLTGHSSLIVWICLHDEM